MKMILISNSISPRRDFIYNIKIKKFYGVVTFYNLILIKPCDSLVVALSQSLFSHEIYPSSNYINKVLAIKIEILSKSLSYKDYFTSITT